MRKLLSTVKTLRLSNDIPLTLYEELPEDKRRAFGIDLSKWAPDWIKPPETQVDFAIMRTSWGLNVDSKYENHSTRLMENTNIYGAYHYYSTAVPWKKQVDHFLELVLNNPTGLKYHMAWWDFEAGYNELSPKAGREFAEAIRYLRMEDIPLVGGYTGNNNYSVFLEENPGVNLDFLNAVPWWVPWPWAGIKNPFSLAINEQPMMGNWRGVFPNRRFVKLKRPQGDWDFWQYSWQGDPVKLGIKDKKQADVNVYNGTVAELKARLGITGGPGPPPEPPPEPEPSLLPSEIHNQAIDEVIEAAKDLKIL